MKIPKKYWGTIILSLTMVAGFILGASAQATTIPTPIAYWNFSDENAINAGTIGDIVGQYGAENRNGVWVANGYSGGAINFKCSNGSYGMVSKSLPPLSTFSALYRVKLSAIQAQTLNSSNGFNVSLQSDSINILGDGMSGGGVTKPFSSNGGWEHFAFVYNSDGYYFYRNGVLVAFGAGDGRSISASPWTFGAAGICNNDVQMDEIKIYNVALTANQIEEEYSLNKLKCNADIWQCEDWGACSVDGSQIRNCSQVFNCEYTENPSPAISQSCTPPCATNMWSCGDWGACLQGGTKTRVCNKTASCQGGVSVPTTTQSCTYIPVCLSFNYSNWTVCGSDGTQTRNIISKYPSNCDGGESPKTTQSCTYISTCTSDSWSCGDWGACSTYGSQIRTCNKTTNCNGGTPPPTTQSCTYTPPCTADTWTCGDWGSCSPSGVQSRSCRMTFDCPSVVTLPPVTDQYCESPNKPTPQTPPSGDDKISNQDTIIKSTVKLMCLFDEQSGMQGSGTIIDSSGLILTNKHVVNGTVGCLVGFINSFNDQPYFGDRQIADILKVSSTEDIAVLKLRNPNNQKLNYINITNGNSNIKLGTKINVYGYPAIFGKNITYTSGDFSGLDGSYLKTTAIIEHGNSGGGSYSNDGTFIGIPSAVVKGELNSLGYILSINTINSWLGNTSNIVSGNSDNNNYSRVSSVLDSIDLKKLGNLQFLVAGSKSAETQSKTLSQTQTQKKSIIVESNSTNQETNIEQNNQNTTPPETQQQKPSLFRRFINWIIHFFK